MSLNIEHCALAISVIAHGLTWLCESRVHDVPLNQIDLNLVNYLNVIWDMLLGSVSMKSP